MTTLAIVPILVQAGTTALSAILAGAGAMLAALFRPLEWLRWCRRKPAAATLLLGGMLSLSWGLDGLGHRMAARSRSQWDWAQVAINLIRSEQAVKSERATEAGPRNLRPLWEFKLPGASFLSTPVLANGRLYAASCIVDVGGTFGSIICLDAANGQPIWQVDKIDNQDLKAFFSSPALTADGKFLVIGEGLHFDAQCHLICLNAATGKLHWKIDVPRNHIESSPAILDDVVVAGAGAIERANHLPVDSPGYALSVGISDGRIRWQSEIIDPESSPVIAPDGVVYIGSGVNGSAVVALDTNGTRLWKTSTPYPATGAVSLFDGLVVIGTGRGDFVNGDPHPSGAVLAFDRTTGRIRWKTQLPDAVLGNLAIVEGRVFCPVRDGTVVALNLENGEKIWSQQISHAPVLAGIASSGDYVYAVGSDGFLAVLDSKTGRLLEKHSLNDEANPGRQNLSLSAPLLRNGRLFVGSETGGLRCLVGTVNP
jgi:outer membrane protein assembly factor BamB